MLGKIVKHTAMQAGGRIIGLIIGLFTIAMMTRYLGQTGFGWYMVAFSWMQLFSIIVDFGLYMIGLKMIGEQPEMKQKIFAQLFWLRFFSAIIFVLLLPQVVWFFPYELPIKIAVAILAWSFFFSNLNQLLTVSFQERLKMQYVGLGEIIGKLGAFLSLWLVVFLDKGFYWAMVSILAYSFIMMLLLFFRLGKSYRLIWFWEKDLVKRILVEAWPLGVIILLNTVYFKSDIIILSWFWPAADVGIYGAAYKVLEILVSFPAMYLGLLLPFFSSWWKEGKKEKLHAYISRSFDLGWMAIVPMIVLGLLISKPVMTLVAGSEFAESGIWLRLLLVAAGFIFLGQLFGYVLVAIGKQMKQLKIFLFVAIVSVILYLIFIPQYGAWAAALITIGAEFLACILLGYKVIKFTQWKMKPKQMFKLFGFGIIMFSVMWAVRDTFSWWLGAMVGTGVYVFMLWQFNFLKFKDIKRLIKE